MSIGNPFIFVRVGSLTMCAIKSEPLGINREHLLLVGHIFTNHQKCIWPHSPVRRRSGVTRYLAGAKYLTRSGTRHLFLETYHFLWTDKPFRLIDRKIKSYTDGYIIRNIISLLIKSVHPGIVFA
jgi:hypothetical protein